MISSSSSRPRIGLVGVAGYAQIYVDLLQRAHDEKRLNIAAVTVIPEHQELPAVADLRERGAEIYSRFEDMIEAQRDQLDLCLIPTGIHWHARMATGALKAGANVLVEKPLAGSVADAQSIIDCEKETGRWVAVGFQDVYSPEVLWLKDQLLSGVIGRIRKVSVVGLWPRPESYFKRTHWAGKLMVDGVATRDSPINNAFAHFVNLSLFLSGPEPGISSDVDVYDSELLRARDIETFDTAVVRARSKEDVDFWFGVSHSCRQNRDPEIIIYGDKGRAEWFHERHSLIAVDGQPTVEQPVPSYAATRQAMFDATLARLVDPETFICSSGIAMSHTRLIESVHQTGDVCTVASDDIDMPDPSDPLDKQIPMIKGISGCMDEAMQQRKMLTDVGHVRLR